MAFTAIEDADNDQVARSWLISVNPRFDGHTPADLVRVGEMGSVFPAVTAFVNDDYYA
ncbi:antitoxin Xre/MbcA/ParS toxin-binding domain-containing protein [Rhodococcus sp. C26F]